jgi:glycine/D-amino acid oxidase-like deaminating enzyme
VDLASGCPFWPLKDGLLNSFPSLTADVSCDVAVVGGGCTGALVAHELVKAGVDVVLLDRREIGTGSTGACTGILQYEIDTPLYKLIEKVGVETAQRSYALGLEAVDKLQMLSEKLGGDVGFARRPSLYLASRKSDVGGLREECAARRAMGLKVDLLSPKEVEAQVGFATPGALLSRDGGEIDAYRLTHALVRRAGEAGLRVFVRTAVDLIRHPRGGIELHTEHGHRIRAKKVVFATGYETQKYLKSSRVKLKTTYAVVSEPMPPVPGWNDHCLIWETARPYFYARTGPDGRILIGGADDTFTDPRRRTAALPRKTANLVRRFKMLFPRSDFRPAYQWAGIFGESDDGLPFIGDCTDVSNAYFAVGYGGNGITFSVIAADIIRDLYLGRPNPDARRFCFDR